MAKYTEGQTVEVLYDEVMEIEQQAVIHDEPDGTWLSVWHGGADINLPLGCWDRLVELVDKAKAQMEADKAKQS